MKTNENSPDWRLEGDYFDGCNCKSICPCIFALDPTEGNCKGVAAWHIELFIFTYNSHIIVVYCTFLPNTSVNLCNAGDPSCTSKCISNMQNSLQ